MAKRHYFTFAVGTRVVLVRPLDVDQTAVAIGDEGRVLSDLPKESKTMVLWDRDKTRRRVSRKKLVEKKW